jgi:hypothetical protein
LTGNGKGDFRRRVEENNERSKFWHFVNSCFYTPCHRVDGGIYVKKYEARLRKHINSIFSGRFKICIDYPNLLCCWMDELGTWRKSLCWS